MPLAAGARLGPYEIVAQIGKGGMGEVYRAHDSRLNRDVAIKVSSANFSERFATEARAMIFAQPGADKVSHLWTVSLATREPALLHDTSLGESERATTSAWTPWSIGSTNSAAAFPREAVN